MAHPIPKSASTFAEAFDLVLFEHAQIYYDGALHYQHVHKASAAELYECYFTSTNNRYGWFNEGAD